MQDRALYSIQEARKLLGGNSRNTIYRLLRTGELASVVIGCRRFISPAAIAELIAKSTTTTAGSFREVDSARLRLPVKGRRDMAQQIQHATCAARAAFTGKELV